ncbi:MAG: ADOP family duplicated permease [Acidobacteriota bacterium]
MRRPNRSPLWRLPADREVREELDFHLEMRIQEYRDQGFDEAEARRRALARFGDPERHAAACRRLATARNRRWRVTQWLDDVTGDLRFAVRQLTRRPLYALTLLGLLVGGLGTAASVSTLAIDALWTAPPYPEASRLVTLWNAQPSRGNSQNLVSPVDFMAWRDELSAVESVAAFINATANLGASSGEASPRRVQTRWVTEGYFSILGREPLVGRHFEPDDTVEGAAPSVVLGYDVWQRDFGGRGDIVGRTVELDGRPNTVIGVTPPRVELAMGAALSPYGDAPDLYRPLPIDERWRTPRGRWMMVVGRLSDRATLDAAHAELAAVTRRQHERHPAFQEGWEAELLPLTEHLRRPVRTPMLALAGAVALVLLIVCTNASNLFLGHLLGRLRELRVRRALGAGGVRIARQLFVESAVIGVLAVVGGGLIARGLLVVARHQMPPELLADRGAMAMPGLPWAIVAGLAIASLLFVAGVPMIPIVRRLGSGWGRSVGASRSLHRIRATLVCGQLVVALVLLVGAGLLLRTVLALLDVDPGFDDAGAVSFSVAPPRGLEDAEIFAFYDRLEDELRTLPGVSTVGAVTHLPLASAGAATSYWPTDREAPDPSEQQVADIRVVRNGYFEAMGIEQIAGRSFDSRDGAGREPGVVVVSRRVAERFWPDGSAIGRGLSIYWGDQGVREVIGVVDDVHHAGLDVEARDAIYFPQTQERESGLSVVLRLESGLGGDAALGALAQPIRDAVRRVDPEVPIFDWRTLDTVVEASMANERFLARIVVGFAVIALVLAVVGIYGVTALRIHEQRREIGVRLALGAAPNQIIRQFVGQTGRLASLALAVGLGVALFAGRAVESMLYGVAWRDPSTLAAMVALLGVTTLAAAWLPARRAARLDPTEVLREE